MTFKCSKCGMCCRNLQNNELYSDLHNGDGICIYLDKEGNLCKIYNNRPIICKVDEAYDMYFSKVMTKEEYYKMNYDSCRELMKNTKSKSINNTFIGLTLNGLVQKQGEAASQIIQALKGVRYDSDGNTILHQGRSLEQISKYKVDGNNSYSSQKQHAGFAGELVKESRDNKQAILNGDSNRTRTTDGVGKTNDQVHDHIKVDSDGNIIENSGSQMKMVGKYSNNAEIEQSSKNVVDKMVSDKWGKYSDSPMDLPTEQVEQAKRYAHEKAQELRNAAEKQRESGNLQKASELENKASRYENAEKNIRDSGVATKEAMEAVQNPNKFVAKEVLKDSHNAGIEAAKSTFIISGAISTAQNLYEVIYQGKDLDDAIVDVVKITIASTAVGYGIGAASTGVKAMMHTSSNSIIRSLGKTAAPTMIITGTIEIGKSFCKYAKGELDELELLEELGQKGTGMVAASMVAASYGAAIGSVILPGVGTVVGGMIGHTLSSILYKESLQALKDERISAERRAIIEKISEEAIYNMKKYQNELIERNSKELARRNIVFNNIFRNIDQGILNSDMDLFFDSINSLGEELGVKLQFKTFDEFDEFMLDDNTVLRL